MASNESSSSKIQTKAVPHVRDTAEAEQASAIVDESGEPIEGSEVHVKRCLQDADELKQEATAHFKAERWTQALATYSSALGRLPKRVVEPKAFERSPDPEANPEDEDEDREVGKETNSESPATIPLTGLELKCAKARSVLNANIGACHVKLKEYKEAVKACTEALADDPDYVKALQRRASCNERLASWSALSSAQEDYNTLLKILPSDSPQIGPTRRALTALKPRVEEAQKRETGEMFDKLKGLGNSILGNFGLSTDNFKFEPNGQGGYSVNFAR